MAMRICLIVVTSVASASQWRPRTLPTFSITQAAATYRTNQGTYVAFRVSRSMLSALRITATNPPAIVTGWSVTRNGCGSPFVTSTDGTNNTIVWVVGSRRATSDYTVTMATLALLFTLVAARTN